MLRWPTKRQIAVNLVVMHLTQCSSFPGEPVKCLSNKSIVVVICCLLHFRCNRVWRSKSGSEGVCFNVSAFMGLMTPIIMLIGVMRIIIFIMLMIIFDRTPKANCVYTLCICFTIGWTESTGWLDVNVLCAWQLQVRVCVCVMCIVNKLTIEVKSYN